MIKRSLIDSGLTVLNGLTLISKIGSIFLSIVLKVAAMPISGSRGGDNSKNVVKFRKYFVILKNWA